MRSSEDSILSPTNSPPINVAKSTDPSQWSASHWFASAQASESNNDYQSAVAGYMGALRCQPDHLGSMTALAFAHARMMQFDRAIVWARRVVQASHGSLESQLLLAGQLEADRQLDAAVIVLEGLLTSHGENEHVLSALGNCRLLLGELELGIQLLTQALALSPGSATIRRQYAIGLWRLHRRHEALQELKHAHRETPNDMYTRFALSHLQLEMGDYVLGYSDREAFDALYPPALQAHQWRGESLEGQRLLVYAQHGLGDTLQYIRYVKQLTVRGAVVTIVVQDSLVQLLERIEGAHQVLGQSFDPPAHDFQCRLMDLPAVLGQSLGHIPQSLPYLRAEEDRKQYWRTQLCDDLRAKVGLCWRGNPQQKDGLIRSCTLENLLPLFECGVSLYSLQLDAYDDELNIAPSLNVFSGLDSDGAFLDTAAVVANLDLVVTIDTSLLHLAGGLGAKVLVMLPFWSDWRWLAERSDTPWYPGMRLFRQKRPHDWSTVVRDICDELVTYQEQRSDPFRIH